MKAPERKSVEVTNINKKNLKRVVVFLDTKEYKIFIKHYIKALFWEKLI